MTVRLNWVPEVRPRAAIGAVLGIALAADDLDALFRAVERRVLRRGEGG